MADHPHDDTEAVKAAFDGLADWLDQIDPDELQREALSRCSAAVSPTAAILQTLADWVRGAP